MSGLQIHGTTNIHGITNICAGIPTHVCRASEEEENWTDVVVDGAFLYASSLVRTSTPIGTRTAPERHPRGTRTAPGRHPIGTHTADATYASHLLQLTVHDNKYGDPAACHRASESMQLTNKSTSAFEYSSALNPSDFAIPTCRAQLAQKKWLFPSAVGAFVRCRGPYVRRPTVSCC